MGARHGYAANCRNPQTGGKPTLKILPSTKFTCPDMDSAAGSDGFRPRLLLCLRGFQLLLEIFQLLGNIIMSCLRGCCFVLGCLSVVLLHRPSFSRPLQRVEDVVTRASAVIVLSCVLFLHVVVCLVFVVWLWLWVRFRLCCALPLGVGVGMQTYV